jgi:hypothetical protein
MGSMWRVRRPLLKYLLRAKISPSNTFSHHMFQFQWYHPVKTMYCRVLELWWKSPTIYTLLHFFSKNKVRNRIDKALINRPPYLCFSKMWRFKMRPPSSIDINSCYFHIFFLCKITVCIFGYQKHWAYVVKIMVRFQRSPKFEKRRIYIS